MLHLQKKTLISELQKYERDTSHITTFSLVNSNIGHEGVLALVQVLNNNKFKNLTHLNLGFNNIGHEGALALVQALNNDKLKNLACLNLGFNNIGHEGALALVQALNNDKLKNLTHLNLSSNNIGHEGALALVQALNNDKLKSLTHLDLRNSNIGHEGIKALNELKNSGRFPNLTIHFGGNTTNKEKPSIRLNNGDNSQSGENANHQPELEDIDINAGGADVINSANGKSEFHGESTQLESSDDNQNNDHLPKSDKLSSEDAERAVKDQSYVFYKQRTDKVC
ncbi:MAG: hypothetical protein PG978_000050 [Wolbachia endosymbiont of Ctenocephalides felis wCfeF]|nr:MAG: hypothetical protein PG978_000050 [Wolbachia endosymbiont of Ctenocephalides felis wCfeF]